MTKHLSVSTSRQLINLTQFSGLHTEVNWTPTPMPAGIDTIDSLDQTPHTVFVVPFGANWWNYLICIIYRVERPKRFWSSCDFWVTIYWRVSILGKIDSDRLIRLSILCYIMYWRSGCTLSNLGTFITHWNKFWKSTHLYAGDGGVLVRFNHSVVCFHVHQPEQQVLPPSSLQNL